MDTLDSRIRREEMRYSAFRAYRTQYSCAMMPTDYVALANSAVMRLVFYDPNFDFRSQKAAQSIRSQVARRPKVPSDFWT
jgi:hypothetical protein